MNCPKCNQEITHLGEHTYEEFEVEGEGTIKNYICENAKCNIDDVYIFIPTNQKF